MSRWGRWVAEASPSSCCNLHDRMFPSFVISLHDPSTPPLLTVLTIAAPTASRGLDERAPWATFSGGVE
jgi:hypothetical protein